MSRTFSGSAGNYLSYVGAFGITTDPLTIFAWIKLNATTSGMICAYENTATHYVALNNLSGAIRGLVQQEYGGNAATTATASVDTWYPVIAIFTAGNLARVVALGNDEEGGFAGAFQAEATPGFSVGSFIQNTGFDTINGKVAHVAIWSTALGAGDISALIAGDDPATIAAGSLVEYWALTGASLVGLNGRTFTVNGTVGSDTGDNPSVSGGGGVSNAAKANYYRNMQH